MQFINMINDCDTLGLGFNKSSVEAVGVQMVTLDCVLLISCRCDALIFQVSPWGCSITF